MNIDIIGDSHLADTLRCAATVRGFTVYSEANIELTFLAEDVYDHSDTTLIDALMPLAIDPTHGEHPVIVLSQVPPGWTRKWGEKHKDIFYQVDTIIMENAIKRMTHPEQLVVGCLNLEEPLPLAYQEYLMAFEAPVLKMSYESAELAKMAINYFLTSQINTSNILADVAMKIGADWEDIEAVLHNDRRIGPYAYLAPGKANKHLLRDVATIAKIQEGSDGGAT